MRKFMTTLLALVMLLSVAMPAFAAAATSPAELTEDASSVDIPIIYNIEYTAGVFNKDEIDRNNPSYRIVVSWTTADGTVTIPGTYAWDAQTAQYITVKGDAADATVTAEASATVKIQNYSNAEICYNILPVMDFVAGGEDLDTDVKARLDSYEWYGYNGSSVTLDRGMIRGVTLPSASTGVTEAGKPVAEAAIPSAHGSFTFKAQNLDGWSLSEETERAAALRVYLFTTGTR